MFYQSLKRMKQKGVTDVETSVAPHTFSPTSAFDVLMVLRVAYYLVFKVSPNELWITFIRSHTHLPPVQWRVFLLLFIHHSRDAVRELGPVRVQTATPSRGEAREEPRLRFTGPVTRAFLLSGAAVARSLQVDVAHQVPPERRSPGLLDVEEHDHVVPLDVEIHVAIEVLAREVEFRRESERSVLVRIRRLSLDVRWIFGERKTLSVTKPTRRAPRWTDVLIADHDK